MIIRLYQEEFKALNGKQDKVIRPFEGLGQIESMRVFKDDKAHFDPDKWTGRIGGGWFWLVR